MRKDRVSSSAKSQCRVYLDNFDLVERLDPATAATLEGQVADTVLELREQYARTEHSTSSQESGGTFSRG